VAGIWQDAAEGRLRRRVVSEGLQSCLSMWLLQSWECACARSLSWVASSPLIGTSLLEGGGSPLPALAARMGPGNNLAAEVAPGLLGLRLPGRLLLHGPSELPLASAPVAAPTAGAQGATAMRQVDSLADCWWHRTKGPIWQGQEGPTAISRWQ
jgi:hypothetical protein